MAPNGAVSFSDERIAASAVNLSSLRVSLSGSVFLWLAAMGILVQLAACSTSPGTQAVLDAVRIIRGGEKKPAQNNPALNPNNQFLRVFRKGAEIIMVKGEIDLGQNGLVDNWYTAQADLMKLTSGHLVAIYGTDVEWSDVVFDRLPDWGKIEGAEIYQRTRDEMPGYRFGVKDVLEISRVEPPLNNKIIGYEVSKLRWFEEKVLAGSNLPPTIFAVDNANKPVYSEVCVSETDCFTWQTWPPTSMGGK